MSSHRAGSWFLSALAVTLCLARPALGDVPKPPGWEEGCTTAKQQRHGEHCVPCYGTLSGRPACADELQAQGYSHRCSTERSGVAYTMLYCKAGPAPLAPPSSTTTTSTAPTTATTTTTTAATRWSEPPPPIAPTTAGPPPSAPTDGLPPPEPAQEAPASPPPAARACSCLVATPGRLAAPMCGAGLVAALLAWRRRERGRRRNAAL